MNEVVFISQFYSLINYKTVLEYLILVLFLLLFFCNDELTEVVNNGFNFDQGFTTTQML